MAKTQKFIGQIDNYLGSQKKSAEDINRSLTTRRLPTIGDSPDLGSNLVEYFASAKSENSAKAEQMVLRLAAHIATSEKIAKHLRNEEARAQAELDNQVIRDRAIRRGERKDHWIHWIQKTIRWTVGMAAAILLYSTAVWCSEHTDFIKVPGRDLIKQAHPAPAAIAEAKTLIEG